MAISDSQPLTGLIKYELDITVNIIKNLLFLRFQGYRCKSGIAIFAWRITWKFGYSPFKIWLIEYVTFYVREISLLNDRIRHSRAQDI